MLKDIMPREQTHHKVIQYTDWASIALFFVALKLRMRSQSIF
jgi:hypothetical protein